MLRPVTSYNSVILREVTNLADHSSVWTCFLQELELDDSSLICLSVPGDIAKKLLHYLKQKVPSSCLSDLLCSHAFSKHYLKRGGGSLEDEELLGEDTLLVVSELLSPQDVQFYCGFFFSWELSECIQSGRRWRRVSELLFFVLCPFLFFVSNGVRLQEGQERVSCGLELHGDREWASLRGRKQISWRSGGQDERWDLFLTQTFNHDPKFHLSTSDFTFIKLLLNIFCLKIKTTI